jgi:post-segregation antitoxin (ccd killing protein)
MANPPKRKVSISLDADLIDKLEAVGVDNLSARVNAALHKELEHELHLLALRELLDELAEEDGSLDTPEDLAEIARLTALMQSLDAGLARPDAA